MSVPKYTNISNLTNEWKSKNEKDVTYKSDDRDEICEDCDTNFCPNCPYSEDCLEEIDEVKEDEIEEEKYKLDNDDPYIVMGKIVDFAEMAQKMLNHTHVCCEDREGKFNTSIMIDLLAGIKSYTVRLDYIIKNTNVD